MLFSAFFTFLCLSQALDFHINCRVLICKVVYNFSMFLLFFLFLAVVLKTISISNAQTRRQALFFSKSFSINTRMIYVNRWGEGSRISNISISINCKLLQNFCRFMPSTVSNSIVIDMSRSFFATNYCRRPSVAVTLIGCLKFVGSNSWSILSLWLRSFAW